MNDLNVCFKYLANEESIFYQWVLGLVEEEKLTEEEKKEIDVLYFTSSLLIPEKDINNIVDIFFQLDLISQVEIINFLADFYKTSKKVVCARLLCLNKKLKDEKELERKLCI